MGTTITVPTQHPAFTGHFPGAPLLPGVVLLDHVLQAVAPLAANTVDAPHAWTIASAKFLHPVRPGETLTVEHSPLSNGSLRFTISNGAQSVAIGTLVLRPDDGRSPTTHEASHHGHKTG